jgi:hypothetical protein
MVIDLCLWKGLVATLRVLVLAMPSICRNFDDAVVARARDGR